MMLMDRFESCGELREETYKHCIYSLLTGLEIQGIESFMLHAKPADYLKLGMKYVKAARGHLRNEPPKL